MATFLSARTLSSYFVRTKLWPMKRMTGSCKSNGKHYPVCMNVNETTAFTHLVTHETCKINHRLHCDERFLIYLITCNECLKEYMDQAIDSLRLKWNNYQ